MPAAPRPLPRPRQVQLQVLAHAHFLDGAEAEAVEGILHGLALGVEDTFLEGYEDFDEHDSIVFSPTLLLRHSLGSGDPGVTEGSLRDVSPLHPAWIPAFAGMTISGDVASLGWGFDTTCSAGMTEKQGRE